MLPLDAFTDTRIACLDTAILGIDKDTRILDIGCGRGQIFVPLTKRGNHVIGLEPNVAYLEELVASLKQHGIAVCGSRLISGSAKAMSFPSAYFDAVICREVLEHIPEPEVVLVEIARVLKPGGRLALSVPTSLTEKWLNFINPYWLSDCGHVNIFSKATLDELLANVGLRLYSVRGEMFFYTFFWTWHGLVHTRHDGTGRPCHHHRLTRVIYRFWRMLERMRIRRPFETLGNRVLPKSYFFYYRREKGEKLEWSKLPEEI